MRLAVQMEMTIYEIREARLHQFDMPSAWLLEFVIPGLFSQ